jgi:hypothetical protein
MTQADAADALNVIDHLVVQVAEAEVGQILASAATS